MTSILCFSSGNQVIILRNETLDLYVSIVVNLQKQEIGGKKKGGNLYNLCKNSFSLSPVSLHPTKNDLH